MIEIGEKATANSTEAITQYGYDAVGNLTSVTDPTGGITTMTYDAVNRLASRTMPNGVTTTYTYDQVDQVTAIAHTTATGTVLASFAYERDATGQPTKITREDGSYRALSYDASLRLTQEIFYDATGTVQETITYTYDAAGNRIAHSDSEGSHTYSYGDGFQLESVVNGTETDTYSHDVDGRLDAIAREGETLNLDHNAADQLTLVTNAATGETVTYTYDGDGNRIGETTGTEVRQYLVAPSMGSGLSVQDLVTDGSGNVLANHVYVGAMPLMRLDGNGEAVYYLTDAMGSVIGLVDSNGQSVASFDYDGFGNVRTIIGEDVVGEAIGGDYRFQSQWLESESGLYYFRARDYDAQTGRFLSRDPVDIIETAPESFNPYQFAYNNPLVYSDPTGEFSIVEINAGEKVQRILDGIKNQATKQATDLVEDKVRGIVGDLISSYLSKVIPGGSTYSRLFSAVNTAGSGSRVEALIVRGLCGAIRNQPEWFDSAWFEVPLSSAGKPVGDGIQCGEQLDLSGIAGRSVRPDFLFKREAPTERRPRAWLIGDIKINLDRMHEDYISPGRRINQFNTIAKFAKNRRRSYAPLTMYILGQDGKQSQKKDINGLALRKGVVIFLAPILPKL